MKAYFYQSTVLITSFAFLAGCAISDPTIGPDSHVGYIQQFYSAQRLHLDPPACFANLTEQEIATGKYVRIRVPHGRRSENIYARVPSSVTASIHDEVEVSPKHCENGVIPTVVRIVKRDAK
ncbi:hypothetical protein [Noviherbaspirillum suwonense]|uniref:Lipoprotein n=1 Tax=Noviherbaspirillum suwonense TaxID=1224511 RepID=A0ABY1QV52_9BURK|nr:hypothetical protein [Noviherbaspirillum suwonense]SMP81067.1 hypothetical protein SAMN06295970_14117 [Noviherbaspirillum suwonense]